MLTDEPLAAIFENHDPKSDNPDSLLNTDVPFSSCEHTEAAAASRHTTSASAMRRGHLVVLVPGPLDPAVPNGHAVVHAALDVAEVELAAVLLAELEVALLVLVKEVLLPGAHRDDVPAEMPE